MGITLTDVSRAAGVSLATASRAFRDADRLAPETRKKVLAAAVNLGYETALPTGSRTFAVVLPDVANAVMASLLRAIQDDAWHGRHHMLLADTAEDSSREQEILESIGRDVEGIILCSPRLPSAAIERAVGNTPLVVINGETDFAARVLMEVAEGIGQAVEHLYALGHRSIVYVPGPASSWSNQRRLNAITEACSEWNINLKVVGNQSASVNGGLAAAAAVVSSEATAVIAYNDLVALGVQAGARSLGFDCPRDLSIVGIDGLDIAAVSEPGLTTIQVATERTGETSLRLLLELMAGKQIGNEAVHLNSQLIVRGSTAVAREQSPTRSLGRNN